MSAEGGLKPVYLLTGSDRPKIERALQRLRARIGEDATEQLDGAGADAVVAACNALGLFGGESRLVVATGVEAWKKADVESLAAYLGDPVPATVLCLVGADVKPDAALAKLCAKAGQVLAYSVAKRDLVKWVGEQFALAQTRADADACAALVAIVGEDLHALASEVSKIATWAGGEPIGVREVEELAASTAETPTFTLTDAWARRDTGRALETTESIFERSAQPRRETAPRLAGALGTHLSRLRQLKRLQADGIRPREAAGKLRMHPFFAEKVGRQAEGFSEGELDDAVVRLAELDVALKGGSRLAPDLELQRALLDLSREPGRHAEGADRRR